MKIKYFYMTDKELSDYLKLSFGIEFPEGYVHFANCFSELDKNGKNLQEHHVCPRCCGGSNDTRNRIKITFHHHRKLHQLILQTKELTDKQRQKLTFAYQKMKKG